MVQRRKKDTARLPTAGSTAADKDLRVARERDVDLSEIDDEDVLLDRESSRPSTAELGGLSEYRARAASGLEDEEGDPFNSISGTPLGGPPMEEDLSIAPEDLGREFLKGAVQDPRPLAPDDEDIPSETARPSSGERRMFENIPESGKLRSPLISNFQDGTDHDEQLSQKAMDIVHRRNARGKRRSSG